MPNSQKTVIRCRGIIVHDDKLLVVKHQQDTSYAALPGGHLEWGEDPKECVRRELVEELGVEPVVGRFLYVNNFVSEDTRSIEFFFEVINPAAFLGCEKLDRSHAHELSMIGWVGRSDSVRILPERIAHDFKEGILLSDETRII